MIIITVNDPWTDIGKPAFITDHLIHWHCFLDNKSSTANIWFTDPTQGPVRGDGKRQEEEEGHQGDLGAQLRVQTRNLSLPGEMGSISISSTLGDVEFEEVEAVGNVAAEAAKEEG